MDDTPAETPADIEANLAAVSDELTAFVDDLEADADESLRLVVQYTADDYEVLYARQDVLDQFPGHEFEERVETLVMKGLGDPPQEGPLYDIGRLEATVRFYENAVVAHVPYREWSGLALAFDRDAVPITSLIEEYVKP